MTSLSELHMQISACTACPLSEGRTNAVPGEGPEHPDVMFIGEAPGFYEDKQAKPFVGQAGKFLDELIQVAGLERKDVYISNVVKCRPPNNRDPLPTESDTCHGLWLDQQIALLQPKVIVTLGRYALTRFFPNEQISRARANARWKDGVLIYPMYHPAAALHQQRLRDTIIDDMRKLPDVIAQATQSGEQAPAPTAAPEASAQQDQDPQQLSMF